MFSTDRFIFTVLECFLSPSTTGRVKVLLSDSGQRFVRKPAVKSIILIDLPLFPDFDCSPSTDTMESTGDVGVYKLTSSGIQIF